LNSEKEEKLKIVGMHCATCVNTVSKAIGKVEGVKAVSVNLATGFAEIKGSYRLNSIVEAVKRAGYDVETKDLKLVLRANPENSRRIMEIISDIPGIISVDFNPSTSVLNLKINPATADQKLVVEKLRDYSPVEVDDKKKGETSFVRRELNSMIYSLVAGAIFTSFVLYFQYRYMNFLAFIFSVPVVVYSGRRYFSGAYRALKNRTADMDTLVALSAGTAWTYSVFNLIRGGEVFFDAASLLITFVLVGKTIDSYLRYRISYIHAPKYTARLESGKIVDSDQVSVGDIIIVKSGEVIPVDGVVEEGSGEVNESILTGETLPVKKVKGDSVISGTTLTNGYIKVYTTRAGERSYVNQLVKAINDASTTSIGLKRAVDRAAAYFTPIIMIIAAITFFIWHFFVPASLALLFAIAVLAAACPCALGLATPLAVLAEIRELSKRGVIVRHGSALEKLKEVKTIIFDKTGTITTGDVKVEPVKAYDENGLELVAALESLSSHPVARAISKLGKKRLKVEELNEFPGEGVMGTVEGHTVIVGKREFIASNCEDVPEGDIIGCVDFKPVISFRIKDEIREGVKDVVTDLKKRYEVIIATGDSSDFADQVGKELGIKVYKGLSPEKKAELVKSFENVMFVGDGVNDALALRTAFVGVAMNTGSEISKQAGDVIIFAPTALKVLWEGAKKLEKRIKENLIWAFGYNSFFIPLAAGVLYPAIYLAPQFAALAMSMNSVTVTLWSFLRP